MFRNWQTWLLPPSVESSVLILFSTPNRRTPEQQRDNHNSFNALQPTQNEIRIKYHRPHIRDLDILFTITAQIF
ncbi:hypothetical protein TNCV_2749161 [Trichonephila clavipes]|nr:hypothetical protein TNCV_2749161 [Trichonephila clavipes]